MQAREWLRAAVRDVAPYTPGEQPPPERRVVKLNTNENPYPPSDAVLRALHEAVDERVRLYPDPEATALREAASRRWRIPVDRIIAGNGSDELLALLLRAVVDPGDRVAFPVPTYSLYETLVAVQGGEPVTPPWNDDWSIPAALADAGARLTIVCNPNSPSGTFLGADALDALAARVRGVLVIDEAYVDFAPGDALALLDRHAHVVIVRTLSKSHSLAGMRVGFAFGSVEILRGMRTVKDSYNLNRLSQVAGIAALDDDATVRRHVTRVRATRGRLIAALRELGYDVPDSAANFVLARRAGIDQGPVAAALAERGVLVRHFRAHDLGDALRITVGTDAEIDTLLSALRDVRGR